MSLFDPLLPFRFAGSGRRDSESGRSTPWPATLVAAPDQRAAAWPNSELGSRVRLVWWPAPASTTPQGRLQRCRPPPADETTGAQSTMTLQRFALKLSCRAPPCSRGRPERAYSVRAASRDRCARPAAALDSFTAGGKREVNRNLCLTIGGKSLQKVRRHHASRTQHFGQYCAVAYAAPHCEHSTRGGRCRWTDGRLQECSGSAASLWIAAMASVMVTRKNSRSLAWRAPDRKV
jgi:hypothetical protein